MNMRTEVCRKCDGLGFTETILFEHNSDKGRREYKVLCGFCLGHGKLDWIENVSRGIKPTSTALELISESLVEKFGNYMFRFNGQTYYVMEEYKTAEDFETKWRHVIMSVGVRTSGLPNDYSWSMLDEPPVPL